MRLIVLIALLAGTLEFAEAEITPSQIVLASYRIEHPKTTGTGFVIHRPDPHAVEQNQYLLVTAAHVFEGMKDDFATLVLRQQDAQSKWEAKLQKIRIRNKNQPVWIQHPKEDVAILILDLPTNVSLNSLPVSVLATADDWDTHSPEPGSFIRCVGYPHAPIFKPSSAVGFATTRLGCHCRLPTDTPIARPPKISGRFQYLRRQQRRADLFQRHQLGDEIKIIGLVHGQHFIDERYKNIYSEGMTRKRLGSGHHRKLGSHSGND